MNQTVVRFLAAVTIGVALRFVVNLEPVWWLVWVVPGLLLALSLRAGNWEARGYIALAAAIGLTSNAPYFLKVMPLIPMVIVMTLQVLYWLLLIGLSRRLVLAFSAPWTVLALPVIGVAVDTLLAHFTPDGNWGSLAYTQADVLPVLQITSVLGVGGVLFLLLLVNSAVAFGIHFGARLPHARLAYAGVAVAVLVSVSFGFWRLQAEPSGRPMNFGIVSIDDFVAAADESKAAAVWQQYQAQITALAAAGARVVLLPEKISVLPTAQAEPLQQRLARVARDNHVWLVVGLGVDTGQQRRNEAWWFAPDGALVTNYLKHFMAPPEREFVSGREFPVSRIEGVNYGVAICKDMHFASLGRGFGTRDAAVMLVPAWDFHDDAWLAEGMTRMRGVENGYAVVRSSRDGLLSVSDAYGRVLSVAASAALPGRSLFATARVGARVPTLYTRLGDVLGWLCVAALVAMAALIARVRRISAPPAG